MSIWRQWQVASMILLAGLALYTQANASAALTSEGTLKVDLESDVRTIVVIGASYAGGWPLDRAVAGYRIINKGINGQQSFEMLARFEQDVTAVKPNAVIIWGFINDVFRSDRAKIDQTLKRTRENIAVMVALAKKAGITPILATEVTIRGKDGWRETIEALIGRLMGKPSYQDYINRYVRETNNWIRDLAIREELVLLDFETVLSTREGMRLKEFSLPDGSHISQQGYEALIRHADSRIRAIAEVR